MPKATLNNEFNDDYEPVRCAINAQDEQADPHQYVNPMTAGSMAGGGGTKKKRKIE